MPVRSSYERIYAAVRRIPHGRVTTYGAIAALAGLPRRARLAGYALAALGDATSLPWHRVVGAGGRLSLARRSADAALTQRIRLENEGVRFDARGRVELAAFAWSGRATAAAPRARGTAVAKGRGRVASGRAAAPGGLAAAKARAARNRRAAKPRGG